MDDIKKIDINENVKIVTANSFVTAKGLEGLSLNARKLFYIAISQCRMNDRKFYEFYIPITELAKCLDIAASNLYRKDKVAKEKLSKRKNVTPKDIKRLPSEINKITSELMSSYIEVDLNDTGDYRQYSCFSICECSNSIIYIKLNSDMTDFLLQLKKNFTQPLLKDFMKMNSIYSIAIWHLMAMSMNSRKPSITEIIQFELSLEELRQTTGTEDKYLQIGEFKKNVLDKAIREIDENCGVIIKYKDIKKSRSVVGFVFTAISPYHVNKDTIKLSTIEKVQKFQLEQKQKTTTLSHEEQAELELLRDKYN